VVYVLQHLVGDISLKCMNCGGIEIEKCMKKLIILTFLAVACFLSVRIVAADTAVNVQLNSGESVVFDDNVAQGDRIRIELQSTGTMIDFFVLTYTEYLNWQSEVSFSSILEGSILINSNSPITTDALEAGRYYVVLENPNIIIRSTINGSISFDFHFLTSATTSTSPPIIPVPWNSVIIVGAISIGIVVVLSVFYLKRKGTIIQKREEPHVEIFPFYLRGPNSPAMVTVLAFGILNIISGYMLYSFSQDVFGIGFMVGGLLICSNLFTTPGGESYIYGHLTGLFIALAWFFVVFPSEEIYYVLLRILGIILGLVSSLILVLRNWYGPYWILGKSR